MTSFTAVARSVDSRCKANPPTTNNDAEEQQQHTIAVVWNQTKLLTRRAWCNKQRDSTMFWSVCGVNIFLAVAIGTIFWNLGVATMADMRSRISVIYLFVSSLPYLLMLIGIYRGAAEVKVFEQERRNQWYTPLPFLLSTVIVNVPENIIHPLGEKNKIPWVTLSGSNNQGFVFHRYFVFVPYSFFV